MLRAGLIFTATVLMMTAQVEAQSLIDKYGKMVSDDAVRIFMVDALKKVHLEKCEGGKPCSAATPQEFEQLPISVAAGRAALSHGIISALAQWCGLNWQRSFLPMIAYGRRQMKMTDRPLMIMTLMHAALFKRQSEQYRTQGTCPARLLQDLDSQLPKV